MSWRFISTVSMVTQRHKMCTTDWRADWLPATLNCRRVNFHFDHSFSFPSCDQTQFYLPFCSNYSHQRLNSFDPCIALVTRMGRSSVFRDREVTHCDVQLPMEWVCNNAVVETYVDGKPCIGIAGWGKGAGVYLRHAMTLCEMKSLPYKEDVYCVCINTTGTKLFFGTD